MILKKKKALKLLDFFYVSNKKLFLKYLIIPNIFKIFIRILTIIFSSIFSKTKSFFRFRVKNSPCSAFPTFNIIFYFQIVENAIKVYKGTNPDVDSYSVFWDNKKLTDTTLCAQLRLKNATDIYVCGLAYDVCVGTINAPAQFYLTTNSSDFRRHCGRRPGHRIPNDPPRRLLPRRGFIGNRKDQKHRHKKQRSRCQLQSS